MAFNLFFLREENTREYIVSEGNNKWIVLTVGYWCKNSEEPNDDKFKNYLITKYIDKNGDINYGKGIGLNDEELKELMYILCKKGTGGTTEILRLLSSRDDFTDALENYNNPDEEDDDDNYIDPQEDIDNLLKIVV